MGRQTEFVYELILDGQKYNVAAVRSGPRAYTVCLNDSSVEAEVRQLRDGGLLVLVDGSSHVVFAENEVFH